MTGKYTLEDIKEEFFIFHIRKLMSKISKTVVRFNVSDEKMEKILPTHDIKLFSGRSNNVLAQEIAQ